MSAIRNPATITSVGRRMMTAGGDITYTKAVLYGQDISHLTREQLESLTSIGNPLVTVPLGISDKNDNGNGTTVILEATFQNSNLKADLPYTAVGFFAKRGDDAEKLIAVGVATDGAYLAATSPDGVATDALDIKVAIAIGDSANVTAMIDPAGSVTPAALHNAITDVKSEMKTGLDTKADKTDVAKDIDTVNKSISSMSATITANQKATDTALDTKADKTTVNQELATKANSTDVDKKLDKKADTSDVDAKIKVVTDLTNTKANTVDVDSKIKTVTDLANTKANSADVYTKTETDNQIASIDFGKIKFRKQYVNSDGQTADKTWSATKNDDGTYTIDLYHDDWTASKLADVLAQLPNKVDTSTVNAQIADTKNAIKSNTDKLQSAINTKANASDVYTKKQVDDAFSSRDATIATKADKQTVTDDLVKKADKTDVDAQIGTVNKSVSDLSDTVKANKDDTDKVLATKADKATVESELSTKANQSDLDKTNSEVAKKASTTDVNNQLATKADAKDVTDALALKDDTVDVDKKISNVTNSVNSLSSTVTSNKSATDTALGTKANANDVANSFEEVRNRVKKLEGQQELTAPDFNTLTSTGIYMIENPTNGKNSPSNGNWGTLVVSRGTTGSDSRILQEYYPDSGDLPYFRMSGPGGVWRDWKQLSDQSEINSLRDAVNTKADKTTLDAYAKSADVANDVKTLQDNINAKADAQTFSDAISKIDLTPFAKTADVNSALSGKADKVTIDAINKALASKRDITDSYSRDELDKKFLQLSADTGGKVSADQVSKLIAGKADQDDVDKKIKAVTDAVNTKANSSDVTSLINSNTDKLTQAINAITYSAKERPLPSNDANEITEDGIYRVGGDPLKNGAGQQWDFLLVKKWDENTIYQMMYGGGKGIFIRNISKIGNSYPEWTRIDIDVNGLQNTLNAKANTADVNTALSKKDDITDVDAKIKTVTDLANTKADASDTYNKKAVDDAFSSRDTAIATKADKTALDATNETVAAKANSDDVYTKSQTDGKLGQKITFVKCDSPQAAYNVSTKPGADGSIVFGIYDMNDEPSEAYVAGQKINIEWLYNHLTDLQSTVNSGLATKADASDVADKIKSLQDSISTKADKATVDSEISKIDFTPYAKTTDVNAELATKADQATVTRDLATKASNTDMQAANAVIATKADKTTVEQELAVKANSADVDKELATKANASDVYTKKQVDDAFSSRDATIATKADKATVDAEISKIDFTPYAKTADVDDKLATKADQTALDTTNKNVSDLSDTVTANKKATDDAIATKADKSYVDDTFYTKEEEASLEKGFADQLDAKADKTTVEQKLSTKANSADVTKELATKADSSALDVLAKTADVNKKLAGKANKTDIYTKAQVDTAFAGRDSSISNATHLAEQAQATADRKDDVSDVDKKVKSVSDKLATKANSDDVYTKADTDNKLGKKISFEICDSPQAAYDASLKHATDGSITFGIYDMNNEPSEAYVAGQKINIEWLYNHLTDLQSTVNNGLATKANQSDLDTTNATVESQATEIASLKAQLNDAVNQINYIKANYIEGKRFAKSDEAQANSWENANPQRIAFITDD